MRFNSIQSTSMSLPAMLSKRRRKPSFWGSMGLGVGNPGVIFKAKFLNKRSRSHWPQLTYRIGFAAITHMIIILSRWEWKAKWLILKWMENNSFIEKQMEYNTIYNTRISNGLMSIEKLIFKMSLICWGPLSKVYCCGSFLYYYFNKYLVTWQKYNLNKG